MALICRKRKKKNSLDVSETFLYIERTQYCLFYTLQLSAASQPCLGHFSERVYDA